MSVKIHHGPPGSYKTSGAVMDDLPPAVREGRPVVTNVRGLSDRERVLRICNGDPRFDLIHVDTTTSEGLDRLRRWFHWVPKGALLIIDEAQRIWPPDWRDSDLRKLDYPGGVEQAREDGRPETHLVAFDMHRHYNWDLVLTTPDIKKIRPEIRGVAEGAYKHRNRAMFGLKGSYLEAFHSPENNGTSANDQYSVLTRRIKPWVWQLYDSTATGEIRDTAAGRPFWRDPRVVGLGLFLVAILAYVASQPLPTPLAYAAGAADDPAPPAVADAGADEAAAVVPASRRTAAGGAGSSRVANVPPPLNGWRIVVEGEIQRSGEDRWQTWFRATRDGQVSRLNTTQLMRMGYGVWRLAECSYRLTFRDHVQIVGCNVERPTEPPTVLPRLTAG